MQTSVSKCLRHEILIATIAGLGVIASAQTTSPERMDAPQQRPSIAASQLVVRPVPLIIGKTEGEASNILEREGFGKGQVQNEPSNGVVVEQDPAAGELRVPHTPVNFRLGVLVSVPDLKGLTIEDARVQLQNVSLILGSTSPLDIPGVQPLRINWQQPVPGSQLEPGKEVSVGVLAKLRLEVSSSIPQVGEEVRFRASFEPADALTAGFRYQFFWGDNTQPSPEQDAPTVSHSFGKPGQFNVIVSAEAGGGDVKFASDPMLVTVGPPALRTAQEPGPKASRTGASRDTVTLRYLWIRVAKYLWIAGFVAGAGLLLHSLLSPKILQSGALRVEPIIDAGEHSIKAGDKKYDHLSVTIIPGLVISDANVKTIDKK